MARCETKQRIMTFADVSCGVSTRAITHEARPRGLELVRNPMNDVRTRGEVEKVPPDEIFVLPSGKEIPVFNRKGAPSFHVSPVTSLAE